MPKHIIGPFYHTTIVFTTDYGVHQSARKGVWFHANILASGWVQLMYEDGTKITYPPQAFRYIAQEPAKAGEDVDSSVHIQ